MATSSGKPGASRNESYNNTAGLLEIRGQGFNSRRGPVLVVCCGLPGSGKSWFAETLRQCKGYVRVSQDELRSKSLSEDAFSDAVRRRLPVVVDRCNPTVESRSTWLSLAHAPATNYAAAVCVYFSADAKTCKQRAEQRMEKHPTLTSQGRINAALKQSSTQFQEPQFPREGFTTFCVVPSTGATDSLLTRYFGVTPDQLAAAKSSMDKRQWSGAFDSLFKFPRTKHLLDREGAHRDDLLMDGPSRMVFFDPGPEATVTVEEKVDGANLGISIDAHNNFRIQNRSHFIHAQSHIQFKALDTWLNEHSTDLFRILLRNGDLPPGRLILFGEWLAATHSISYTRLPDRLLAFDIYDREKGKFLSRSRFNQCLEGTSLKVVPTLTYISLPLVPEEIKGLLTTQSSYSDGTIEGVYLRVDRGDWLFERAKVVRHDFIAGDDHWTKGETKWNKVLY